jgi:hypothetical protein
VVNPGSSYPVSVRAVNAIGVGAASAVKNTLAAKVPSAPVITTATAGNTGIKIEANLGSANGSPITDIEYSTDGGKTWASSGQITGTFTITNETDGEQKMLQAETTYEIKIRAISALGSGASSNSMNETAFGKTNKISIVNPNNVPLGTPAFLIKASSSSKKKVFFKTETPAVCVINAGKVAAGASGVCTLTASSNGTGAFPNATPVSFSFNVVAPPAISVGSMTNVRDLAKAGAYKLATKGKMTVKSTTPNVCTVKGVSVVGVASGQCSLLVKVGSAKAVRVRASVAS